MSFDIPSKPRAVWLD